MNNNKLLPSFPFVCVTTLFITGLALLHSCRDNTPSSDFDKDEIQFVAGRIFGTWTTPIKKNTPDNVPAEIFGDMRLFFSIDEKGYPLKFIANNCPIVFNSGEGSWSISKIEGDEAEITLQGISPVDNFTVKVSAKTMVITFYMGWENTETRETGEGDFSVTLCRK